jgi:hypothetical protein
MIDSSHMVTNWPTLLVARSAYSVPLIDKGQCRVFEYDGRCYTTTTMAYAIDAHTQEAWCYEVVPLKKYTGDVPADRLEPLRRHTYPGLIVKIEGTEEEVVITGLRLYLKAEEPEEERQAKLLMVSSPGKKNERNKTAAQTIPVDGQLPLL